MKASGYLLIAAWLGFALGMVIAFTEVCEAQSDFEEAYTVGPATSGTEGYPRTMCDPDAPHNFAHQCGPCRSGWLTSKARALSGQGMRCICRNCVQGEKKFDAGDVKQIYCYPPGDES